MRLRQSRRSGTTVVECAVVYPVVLIIVAMLVIGALGVFRYQELASIARRATRYATVHGTQYTKDTGKAAATSQDIYDQAVQPYAAGYDLTARSYSVSWTITTDPHR